MVVSTRSKTQKSAMAPSATAGMKFDKNVKAGEGKVPVSEPVAVSQIFVLLVIHVCQKILLFKPNLKVTIYLGAIFFVGIIGDFFPLPKSYLSYKNNFFNVCFVKKGWAWTLVIVGSFMYLTSYVYCCGEVEKIKKSLYRLGVGTFFWYTCTSLFVYIEEASGMCSDDNLPKVLCFERGYKWYNFSISGHCFLLIYCNLLMMEEAQVFRSWNNISELIRVKEYDDESPLRYLTEDQLSKLKDSFNKFTPYIRGGFVAMASLLLIWDVMLIGTILYFHSMIEKAVGAVFAVSIWFFCYQFWYPKKNLPSPSSPGEGLFKYATIKQNFEEQRRSSTTCRHLNRNNGFKPH